uniref:Methanethiol oxidase n=1 Tax=Globodera rostochiensis TaxID=31243 RepID=A0A914HXL3_GLORO
MSQQKCQPPPACGPGFKSPGDAFQKGPREKVIFVTCPNVNPSEAADIIASVDVDPDSETFCKVIGRLQMPHLGDEVHHTGWNACSSCHSDALRKRTHLFLPCLNSSRIYTVDVSDPRALKFGKIVETDKLAAFGVSFPHTAHCLADGSVMVSTIGDERSEGRGDFVLLDGTTFCPLGKWPADGNGTRFGYDFWYQPRQNLMLSTEWGTPNKIQKGFDPSDVAKGDYGNCVHVWDWQQRRLTQSIELSSPEGQMPLEVRFLHNPNEATAFVGTALGSAIFHFWRDPNDTLPQMCHRLAVAIPPKKVRNWAMDLMPALVTDILLSMDDRFLFLSCWLHGDIRQYDISDPFEIKLVGQCFVGGSVHTQSGVEVLEDKELKTQPEPLIVRGHRVEGGPQMLQLSLDGRRLYVTNSLYSVWDAQFYPELIRLVEKCPF